MYLEATAVVADYEVRWLMTPDFVAGNECGLANNSPLFPLACLFYDIISDYE